MNSLLLEALEHTKNGRWEKAHEIVQELDSREAAWIHGLLHRIEGDDRNAAYWYRLANVDFPTKTNDAEWQEIHETLSQ